MDGKPDVWRIECVTKQPLLTGFPSTVFASAKRRLQAALRGSCALIRSRSLAGYAVLFEDVLPGAFLQGIDPICRQRSFGHLPVFWAWLAQILEANASCQKAVGLLQSWCRACALPVPSSSTASYCRARQRLSEGFLQGVHQRILTHLRGRCHERDQWKGFTLKAIDGSSVQLMDTDENQSAYPQPSGQKPGCGLPTMGIEGLLGLGHGAWEHFVTCHHTQHDSKAAAALLGHLQQGDLLLADRAFCTYEIIARSLAQGAHVLMRLHQSRAKALDWPQGRRTGPSERQVVWKRPPHRSGSTLSPEQWDTLPESLTLRMLRVRRRTREGGQDDLIVVTTLLNARTHDGGELAALYARRWEIELKLRDLKTTLGMEFFAVKSAQLAHKTLWMSVIAFNLVRSLMQRAAAREEMPVWHLSFKGVLDLVVASQESSRVHAGHPQTRAAALSQWLEICATKLIDQRPQRREPRAVKRRPKTYPLLTSPRHLYNEITHRNRYHAIA